ncbi:MAG: dephospho-CoA kinase [Deltaproteobacteria bacterium]|nr:dephospho-CoA kinase [Deltaproteobacteria bacterium]MBW2049413.1 dephospho-CoA kinase [Deltaproteobacteria bacterium]MBW2353361.1 dephospho-CoA kinase [Deltaproteobacteria bacterium]
MDLFLPEMGDLLILGVTGGIASGKTTVAHMLAELGARIIDFDLLARDVVRPGEPAFGEIVGRFGDQVVAEDGALDRKRLSGLVFCDPQKRKMLEEITHPRIVAAFVRQVREMAGKNPRGILLAVIPLLFEAGLRHLVHKTLVVYVPPGEQVERLMRRDRITRKEAGRILRAQMPIQEKVGMADFVIQNQGEISETRREVEALWRRLEEARKRTPGAV